MAFDPNDRTPNDRLNDPRTTPGYQTNHVDARRSSSWMGWVAVIAVILVGAFVWSQMGGTGTDPQTTSSTAPSANQEPVPLTPAPPSADPAPATPPAAGGANGAGGTGTQP